MSDYEGGPAAEDDLSLPRATVYKLIAEALPDDIACAKDTRDLLLDCCNEFIHLIASESNEICEKEAKKTIAAEHVLAALQELGFEKYVGEVQEAYDEHRKQLIKDRDRKSTKLSQQGMSEEEMLRSQQLLFAEARMRYQNPATQAQSSGSTPTSANGSQ
ncbi:negative cofactor 2 transcription regulator complex subunit ncb2 [Coemansia biformis]|uniref:Negative cofactor 2 transcription regulator complex subunit ncb2 n=1 Tax=Coemansia biformis TaxID=1286918 RepID=A0A9W7YBC2_9FUNG|nr:negative cofactor 2 transcription regulator complex subunit ncb2 [Coemansia biformis]